MRLGAAGRSPSKTKINKKIIKNGKIENRRSFTIYSCEEWKKDTWRTVVDGLLSCTIYK